MAALTTFSATRNVRATEVVLKVLEQVGEDEQLLDVVIRQLIAIHGHFRAVESFGSGNIVPEPRVSPTAEKTKAEPKRKGRGRSKGSKSPKPSKVPPPLKPAVTPKGAPEKPRIDEKGVKKTTWDNRLRSCRQRALENYEAFKMNASPKSGAVFCNSYWTLRDQWENYRKTPFYNENKVDPLHDLPQLDNVGLLAGVITTKGWKRDTQNGHFIIQTEEGDSLRGEKIFRSLSGTEE